THYSYDVPNRTHTTTFPDTGAVTEVFDVHGQVLRHTDQRGNVSTQEYNANYNPTKFKNALGDEVTATYDPYGKQTSRTDAHGTQIIEYNSLSLPSAIIDRLHHRTTIDYDDNGSLSGFADSDGTRLKFTNGDQGLPATVEDAEGNVARLEHDAAGNVTKRTDWLGRGTGATYDEAGHQLTLIGPRGGA